MANVKTATNKNIAKCKAQLEAVTAKFDTFEINGKRCEEILSKCTKLQLDLNPLMKTFKDNLLNNKVYELVTEELKMSELFGRMVVTKVRVNLFLIFF